MGDSWITIYKGASHPISINSFRHLKLFEDISILLGAFSKL